LLVFIRKPCVSENQRTRSPPPTKDEARPITANVAKLPELATALIACGEARPPRLLCRLDVSIRNCSIIAIAEMRADMGAEEKIALDLALVLLIIVLVWARWQR
jgi:hypothetical protein